MDEKLVVGFAMISVIAVTIFFNEEKQKSQIFIEDKKAVYQDQFKDKSEQDKPKGN